MCGSLRRLLLIRTGVRPLRVHGHFPYPAPESGYGVTSYVPSNAFLDGIFSPERRRRQILVLKAFFDDSGTHSTSEVVVMGGLIADESVWANIEREWGDTLKHYQIRRMHMSHCEAANPKSEFANFDRTTRSEMIDRFSGVIKRQGLEVMMLSAAVNRITWKSVQKNSALASALPCPIDYCFNWCMRKAISTRQASKHSNEPVFLTFDSREQSVSTWSRLASGYAHLWPNRISGYDFARMDSSCALQAADMVAYETYKYMHERETTNSEPVKRKNFADLIENCAFDGAFFTEENLQSFVRATSREKESR
jgi:Protein of unknown function (DUF3800)